MTYSSSAAAAIPAAQSSTLSPHAAPFTLRSRPVCAPPGCQQDGDSYRLIDDNLMLPAAYFGMESCDAVYPGSAHGMPSQPSSSSGIHVNAYPTSSSSTTGYTWMDSELRQDHFPLTSGEGKNGNKSTKVTIKCPPNRTLETNNIGGGSKSKLAIRENDDCNNEAGKAISFGTNSEINNLANESGSSQGTMELNPVLKPLYIPSTRASSHVSVADDGNPDPSECSVDSPCWQGALSSRVSSLDVRQASDGGAVKKELVDFNAGKSSTAQDCQASTEIEKLVASKSKQNHSQPHVKLNHAQPHVKLGLIEKPEVIDTNMKSDFHGKELGRAEHGSRKCNAEHTYCLEVRNNSMKQSGLNSAAPDFIPLSVRKSSSGNGLGSSIILHGSCSSTGRNTSEILKEIKSKSDVLQKNHSDDIELEEHDLSLLQSIIENLQSYLHKATKGPVKVASDKAGLKACHSQNAVLKSVAVKQNA
ncbi:hypothetical protein QOZ80_8BG0645610 [Eleusine coracana subsp. coracana]|nr:hypothetical protein QOZ80_8BG0645610 [Eleusine coracana subsp. coracana]